MFRVRLRLVTFEGAINAWVALGASEDATARAAARALDELVWRVVHTASRSLSLATGAVVSAVAPRAASAPGLQLANTGVARALAPAVAVEAPSSTFGLEAASPTPEVVMADASASTSGGAALEDVAPAPAAADGYESDGSLTLDQLRERARLRQDAASSDDDSDDEDQDSFQAIAPDADGEDVEEALQNAESEELAVSASDLAALERYLAEAVREDIFRPGLRDACSAHCASRAWRISSGVTMETGDQAALLAVLKAKGVDVEGLDPVRGGARYNFSRRPSLRDFVAAIDRPTPSYPRRPKMQYGSTPSATRSGPPRNTPSTTRTRSGSRGRSASWAIQTGTRCAPSSERTTRPSSTRSRGRTSSSESTQRSRTSTCRSGPTNRK